MSNALEKDGADSPGNRRREYRSMSVPPHPVPPGPDPVPTPPPDPLPVPPPDPVPMPPPGPEPFPPGPQPGPPLNAGSVLAGDHG